MPDVLWGGLQNDKATVTVTSVGTQPGPWPAGGDAWVQVGRLPTTRLLPNRHYAFIVTGYVQNLSWSGTTPQRGLVQVCLGDSFGTKHHWYRAQLNFTEPVGPYRGMPFQFMVLFSASPSITDPYWGATWSNAADLVLWARGYRNGDAANYSVSFDVASLSWLWFDLDSIPSNCQLAHEYNPLRSGPSDLLPPLGSPPAGAITMNTPGVAGELWLHFSNLWFTPRGNGGGSKPALFQHGYVTDGTFGTFAAKVGSGFRWGTDTRGTSTGLAGEEPPTQQLGSFWPQVQPSGTAFRPGYQGVDSHVTPGMQTLLHRWRYLGVRIDQLPEARNMSLTNGSAAANIATEFSGFGSVFAPWEPGPQTGLTAEPVVLAHGILNTSSPGTRSHTWWIQTNRGRQLWAPLSFSAQRGPLEGVPVLAFGEAGALGVDPLEVRYEFSFLRIDGEPYPTLWPVQDAHFVTFWFVQNPSNVRAVTPLTYNPLVLVPSREGLALTAQADLPQLPDRQVQESVARGDPHSITGTTGYRRTWPAMTAPRRQWELTWTALRDSERTAMASFLRTHPTFRWRPPQDTGNVAAAVVDQPRWAIIDTNGPLWSLHLRVVELIHLAP